MLVGRGDIGSSIFLDDITDKNTPWGATFFAAYSKESSWTQTREPPSDRRKLLDLLGVLLQSNLLSLFTIGRGGATLENSADAGPEKSKALFNEMTAWACRRVWSAFERPSLATNRDSGGGGGVRQEQSWKHRCSDTWEPIAETRDYWPFVTIRVGGISRATTHLCMTRWQASL